MVTARMRHALVGVETCFHNLYDIREDTELLHHVHTQPTALFLCVCGMHHETHSAALSMDNAPMNTQSVTRCMLQATCMCAPQPLPSPCTTTSEVSPFKHEVVARHCLNVNQQNSNKAAVYVHMNVRRMQCVQGGGGGRASGLHPEPGPFEDMAHKKDQQMGTKGVLLHAHGVSTVRHFFDVSGHFTQRRGSLKPLQQQFIDFWMVELGRGNMCAMEVELEEGWWLGGGVGGMVGP